VPSQFGAPPCRSQKRDRDDAGDVDSELNDDMNAETEGDARMTEADEAMRIFMSLGVQAGAARNIVVEIYSPPRVSESARLHPSIEVGPSFAFDFTADDENGNPWDFREGPRRKATRAYREPGVRCLQRAPGSQLGQDVRGREEADAGTSSGSLPFLL
jgi:hypothetical protein